MKIRTMLLLPALSLGGGAAHALCLPAVCTCTVQTTNVAFGSYNPLAFGNIGSTGSVKIGCGGVVGLLIPYTVAISAGGSNSFTTRTMSSGAYTLGYNLYTDAAYTTIWGDGSGASLTKSGSFTLDALGLAPAQTHTVYGNLPGRQLTAAPGLYTDTISVTLTYF